MPAGSTCPGQLPTFPRPWPPPASNTTAKAATVTSPKRKRRRYNCSTVKEDYMKKALTNADSNKTGNTTISKNPHIRRLSLRKSTTKPRVWIGDPYFEVLDNWKIPEPPSHVIQVIKYFDLYGTTDTVAVIPGSLKVIHSYRPRFASYDTRLIF